MAGFAAAGIGSVSPVGLAEGLTRELADGKRSTMSNARR